MTSLTAAVNQHSLIGPSAVSGRDTTRANSVPAVLDIQLKLCDFLSHLTCWIFDIILYIHDNITKERKNKQTNEQTNK